MGTGNKLHTRILGEKYKRKTAEKEYYTEFISYLKILSLLINGKKIYLDVKNMMLLIAAALLIYDYVLYQPTLTPSPVLPVLGSTFPPSTISQNVTSTFIKG